MLAKGFLENSLVSHVPCSSSFVEILWDGKKFQGFYLKLTGFTEEFQGAGSRSGTAGDHR